MRIFLGGVVAVLLLGTSIPAAQAGPFSWLHRNKDGKTTVKRCLPKPIDYPFVRPRLDETHKLSGKRVGKHPKSCGLIVTTADRA
jgi:hypothetical protein